MALSIKSPPLQAVEGRLDDENSTTKDDRHHPQVEVASHQNDPVTFKPRSYQLEMLDESLRRNIIVAVSPLNLPNATYY